MKDQRFSPGMIGWGIERPHLIDRQALKDNIEKAHVRTWDTKRNE